MNSKEINKKLKEYFSEKYLEVLDTVCEDLYTGVTLDYIHEYLFEDKVNSDKINAEIMTLLGENYLNCLYCGNVDTLVFENATPGTGHWKFVIDKIDNVYKFNPNEYNTDEYNKEKEIIEILEKSYYNKFQNQVEIT